MNNTYTRTAIGLHWLIALALVGSFALGTYMSDLALTPRKLQLYSWHKWAGITIFLLVLIRLGWRLGHTPPPLPATMPAVLKAAAHFTHIALYVLMIVIPLSGWLMSSAKGVQTIWFGLVPLPDLLAKDEDLGKQLASVHMFLNYTMAALVLTHIGAALKHHFIDRDDILRRMLPGRSA